MAGPPSDRNPMFQGANEKEEAYDSRMQERQKYFDRNVHWKKQQTETLPLPLVPVAQGLRSSGNVCPGPTDGGNLSFEQACLSQICLKRTVIFSEAHI